VWTGTGTISLDGISGTAQLFSGKIPSFGLLGDDACTENTYHPNSVQFSEPPRELTDPGHEGFVDSKVLKVDQVAVVEDVDLGNSTSATGTGSSIASANFTHNGGTILACVAYRGDFDSNSATGATYGSQNMTRIRGAASSLNNVGIEVWKITNPTGNNVPVMVNFSGNRAAVLCVVEIKAADLVKRNTDAVGTTSPLTVSLAAQGELNRIIVAIGAMLKGTSSSTLSLTNGIAIMNSTDVGTSSNKITAAVAYKRVTNATDTISWSQSVNREWGEVVVELSSGSLE
jgi:hypothetical protein